MFTLIFHKFKYDYLILEYGVSKRDMVSILKFDSPRHLHGLDIEVST